MPPLQEDRGLPFFSLKRCTSWDYPFRFTSEAPRDSNSLSLLDFCPYTKCWDVHEQIIKSLNEMGVTTFKNGQTIITISSDLTVLG